MAIILAGVVLSHVLARGTPPGTHVRALRPTFIHFSPIVGLPLPVSAVLAQNVGLAEPRKYVVAGRLPPPPGHEPVAATSGISPHYFETVGTRVLDGRTFTEADILTSPKVFIVNQAMARGLFGGESPLGRRIARSGGKAVGACARGLDLAVQTAFTLAPDPRERMCR